MREFISFGEARSIVLSTVPQQPQERIGLDMALGRTLAQTVHSPCDMPPFDNAAMDGFAVRAADLARGAVRLTVVEEIAAGHVPHHTVTSGTCAEIMTGAPLPEGADAVVPVEWTNAAGDGTVQINRAVEPGKHVRRAAKDVRRDEQLFEQGQIVTPPVVAMLAMFGVARVSVCVAPRVAIIATGNELVDVAEEPQPGQVRNVNGPALAAQVHTTGGVPLPPFLARDGLTPLHAATETALEADMLVFSGGVSVGKHDYVKEVLGALGMEMLFWKVRQRPGKPLVFGMLRGKPVFGLPGNPTAAAVCFEQYVRPALAKMLGRKEVLRPLYDAVLDAPLPKKPGLHYFSRGRVFSDDAGSLRVRPAGSQAVGRYGAMAQANCIVHMPEPLKDPPAGTPVQFAWLPWV